MPANKSHTEDSFHAQDDAKRRVRHESRANTTYRRFLRLASARLSVSPEGAEKICIAVLSALARRVPPDEMFDLASQLPSKLRERLAREKPQNAPRARDIGEAEFLAMVAQDLDVSPDKVEAYVRAVFQLLAESVSPGEVGQIIHVLPASFRALWPAGAAHGRTPTP